MGEDKQEPCHTVTNENIENSELSKKKSSKLYSVLKLNKKEIGSFPAFKTKDSYEKDSNKAGNLNSIALENLVSNKGNKEKKDVEAVLFSDTETDELLQASTAAKGLSVSEVNNLRRAVVIISWLSLCVLFGLGIFTLVVGILFNSPSSFAFALDAILDCFSSGVIIWRFHSPDAINSYKKEKRCVISLGVLFMLSAFSVIARSSEAIKYDMKPTQNSLIWYLAIVDGLVCVVLFISYLYIATKLRTVSLLTDAIIALMGAVLAVATLAGDLVYERHENIWYLDPLLGIISAVFMLLYGFVIVIYEVCCHKDEDHYKDISENS